MTVGQALERKGNNFNLLRMLGALFIVLGHSILLTGRHEALRRDHPVLHEGIELLGYNSLYVFFVLSGLMVAMSLDRRQSLAKYTAARALRILPPLLLVSAALALVLGPLMTRAGRASVLCRSADVALYSALRQRAVCAWSARRVHRRAFRRPHQSADVDRALRHYLLLRSGHRSSHMLPT